MLFVVLAGVTGGCGYRSVAQVSLPGGATSVQVLAPDVSRLDEPLVGPSLAGALHRELARRGLRPTSAQGPSTTLLCRCHDLHDRQPRIAGATLVSSEMALALECRLFWGDGQTLWRSGRLVVRQDRQLVGGSMRAGEGAKRSALESMAAEAAARVVERMTLGM